MTARGYLAAAGAALALLVGAFAAGRYSAQEADVREVFKDRVVYKDRIVTVKEAAEVKRVVVYRERTVKPDGTKVEREVERTDTDTKTAETVVKATEKTEARDVERVVEAAKPQWHVGVMAGTQVRLAPLIFLPSYGVHIERRIIGPFFLGVWGVHPGAVGASISAEF